MGWVEYWDDKPTIYVNDRHRVAHYRCVADGLIGYVGAGRPVVLDYGCGEALNADDVAKHARHLYLCDAAASVRAELTRRFAQVDNITVIAPEDLATWSAGPIDLIVANSVVQYLDRAGLDDSLASWKRLLSPGGRILLADIIPPSVGPLTDATALLRFGLGGGFLIGAFVGLVRTFFSDYRKIRASLGLQQLEEREMLGILAEHGFEARRVTPNLGHNQARMAFIATHGGRAHA